MDTRTCDLVTYEVAFYSSEHPRGSHWRALRWTERERPYGADTRARELGRYSTAAGARRACELDHDVVRCRAFVTAATVRIVRECAGEGSSR